jgi:hypothetical protein
MYRRFATYIGKEEKDLSSSPPFRVHTPYPSLWVDNDGMVFLDPATREKKRVRPPSFPPIVAVSTPKEHHFPGY